MMSINLIIELDNPLLIQLADHFNLEGSIESFQKIGSGHIHQTFQLRSKTDSMLLQRINSIVFPKVDELQNNLRIIEEHFTHSSDLDDLGMSFLKLRKSVSKTLFKENAHYWRAFEWINSNESFDKAPNSEYAFAAAQGFGRFVKILSSLPLSSIHSAIPDFHDGKRRWNEFEKALIKANPKRKLDATELVEFAQKRNKLLISITQKIENGIIPARLTHNDTKLNNILFYSGIPKVKCVIDLDTVMSGCILFDFGDMVRTISNAANEDCENLGEINIDEQYFEAICRGYSAEVKTLITKDEKEELLNGAKYMCLIIGLRFLTDYLNGDVYYPTQYENHNLIRARNQFRLVEILEEKGKVWKEIINNNFKN
ncbi:phosphotransferase enzyme family protein [Fulvivirgaceae bacterium LMO-SS25]